MYPFQFKREYYCELKSIVKPSSPKSGHGYAIFSLTKVEIVQGYWLNLLGIFNLLGSFRQRMLTIEIVAHVRKFLFDSSRVDNTMLDLAQNNIKCALSQLTTCRPPPSVLIPLSRNMRNVLKRMKKQFAEFYFLNYREN